MIVSFSFTLNLVLKYLLKELTPKEGAWERADRDYCTGKEKKGSMQRQCWVGFLDEHDRNQTSINQFSRGWPWENRSLWSDVSKSHHLLSASWVSGVDSCNLNHHPTQRIVYSR